MMRPTKLKEGDEIRVISPSRSLAIISEQSRAIARERFEAMGLKLTFSKHAEEKDDFNSSSIESRVEDLQAAFADKKVKAIITTIGGFNCNQLLRYIDYSLLRKNPKIFCGYSDITALQNTFLAKAGLVTYYGPHFSSFGMKKGFEYTSEYFKKCLFEEKPFEIKASREWSDDEWYKEQEKRKFLKNHGHLVFNEGQAEGKIIGGNLNTLNLLQGTEYMPSLKGSVLFIEDDDGSKPYHFDRDLQSLIHLPDFKEVKGLVIGRFQSGSEISYEQLKQIVKTKKELSEMPVVVGVDFGHTTPQITFPIGGKARVQASKDYTKLEILEH